MSRITISRRRFLVAAAAGLGAVAVTGSGLAVVSSRQRDVDLPAYSLGEKTMSNKILVTYASLAGSTAGVAEAIGKVLAEGDGRGVDVRPMKDVNDLSAYSAVVAGSAIHGQKWLPEAMDWLAAHQTELRQKPFGAFLVCITLSMRDAEKYRSGVSEWMKPVREMVRPVGEGLFAGGLDFSRLPVNLQTLPMHVPVMLGMWQEGDHRDWNAIRAWAQSIAPRLGA